MSDESSLSTESETDLLQRRLNNKQQRITKSLQFTILSATVVLAVPGISDSGVLSFPPVSKIGAAVLVVSGFAGFSGLAVGATSLDIQALSDDPRKIATQYQCRNTILGCLQVITFSAGGAGVVLLLAGVIRATSRVNPLLSLTELSMAVLVVTVVAPLLGCLAAVAIRPRTE